LSKDEKKKLKKQKAKIKQKQIEDARKKAMKLQEEANEA